MQEIARKENFRYLPWIICAFIGLFYFYAYLLRVIPSVITSQLLVAYRLNVTSFRNLEAAYYYTYIPIQILVL